jgi:energy-coupling factor transporter ATP-binding protein EcfA2
MRRERAFLIITGSVGAGKSTLALALAELLRRESAMTVAVIDLDIVYCMLRQKDGFAELELWPVARRACAALTASLFAHGFDAVVLEGEFFTPLHFEEVLAEAPDLPPSTRFTLNVSYAETLRRVALDPSRGASKNPEFLMQLHTGFVAALPFLRQHTTIMEADRQTPRELAVQIAAQLG